MARKPQITETGLLAESFGRRPYTVTIREEKEPGSNVILDYTVVGGTRRKRTLGYPVRWKTGRRWEWGHDALDRAREAAEDRSAELRLARDRAEILDTGAITFGQAVAMYTDPERGGLPQDPGTRKEYIRYLAKWSAHFQADIPWSRIRRNDVEARVRKLREQGKVPTALKQLAVLRALYGWLTEKAQIPGLSNPVQGFDWKKLRDAHQVRHPRFTPGQVAAIVKVRHDVDPRFALFLSLMDDSGARSKAVRILMRSAVDVELEAPPSAEEAPCGWILFPALKGQKAPLHLLTAFERREVEIAFAGYLGDLEARWQEEHVDYPLFPGARLADRRARVVGTDQPGAYRSVDPKLLLRWFRDAEAKAGVEHIARRAFHGIRRTVSDLLLGELGLDGLTVAMGWSSRNTPEQIYVDQRRMPDRVEARKAMERKRGNDVKP